MITIVAGKSSNSVTCAPAWGGRITCLSLGGTPILRPIVSAFPLKVWPKAGAFPLGPFGGRVRGGLLRFDGRIYQLPLGRGEQHALHGIAMRTAWQGEAVGKDRIRMWLDHCADENWPWNFQAEQNICCKHSGITIRITITNTSDVAAPASIGWHPYFINGTVRADAKQIQIADDTLLPSATVKGAATPLGGLRFLSDVTPALMSVDGNRFIIRATGALRHAVWFDTGIATCIEHCSHLPGMNSIGQVDGYARLNIGEFLTGEVILETAVS